jgi:hypothetical protein
MRTRKDKLADPASTTYGTPRKRPAREGEGRPTLYTKQIAEELCTRLASGESLLQICKGEHMPSEACVRAWVIDDIHQFGRAYARARDLGLDTIADQVLEIADRTELGKITTTDKDGKQSIVAMDMVAHRRLRFDARRWYLSKLAPKKYGDKLDLMHRGDSTAPIVISSTDAKL